MKTLNSGPLSSKRRQEIRKQLTRFLRKPKTRDQVADKFSISGISAGAFLKFLMWNQGCQFDPETKTYFVVPVYASKHA